LPIESNSVLYFIGVTKLYYTYKIVNKLQTNYGDFMTNFTSVKKFMEIFGQEVKTKAEFPSDKIVKLRHNLIKEELDEFEKALKDKNLKEVADALADILYVTYGAGHAFGIDLDKCFDEVQRSNMSKLGENGKPIYNDQGKVMKGPNYFEPNLKKYI